MDLRDKTVVIAGGSGSIGRATAGMFARHGASVFIAARDIDRLAKVAEEIKGFGGQIHYDSVDAMDSQAVDIYLDTVRSNTGVIDVLLNAVDIEDVQGAQLIEMEPSDFLKPIEKAMCVQYNLFCAAGRIMKDQGHGLLLSVTATPGGIAYPLVGGFGPACVGIETLTANFACELGPYGVRAVNIRSAGSPDSDVFRKAIEQDPGQGEDFIEKLKADTMTKELPLVSDIAGAALFLASGLGNKITGTTIDVTIGTTTAINYRATPIAF